MPTEATAACLNENVVLDFVNGRLSVETRNGVERHLTVCSSCTVLVALAAREHTGPISVQEGPRNPGPKRQRGSSIGRYTILDLVGQGGMGAVYAAYDPELDRRVAVKVLHEGSASDDQRPLDDARTRLLREAKAIARLSHPNVIVIHDAGTVDGRVFIAMEFVRGVTLAEWLRQRVRTWKEIRDAFLAAGRGLAAAHAVGLVHRDVKPQNIMVGDDGTIRVTDFGLASDAQSNQGEPTAISALADSLVLGLRTPAAALTRTGAWLGTPLYMAPEQFRAEKTDARTDQFSFCVSLYEAVYGERPFAGETLPQLRDAVLAGQVREPTSRSRAPAGLRRILLRGLSVQPRDRFPSMEALLAALERDPARLRRRAALGVLTAASLLVAGAVVQRSIARPTGVLCTGGTEKLTPVWELADVPGPHPRREASRLAFAATGKSYATDSWTRAAKVLDEYSGNWLAMFKESCEATHLRGEQSAQVLDLRADCLNSALDQLRATTDLFIKADAEIVSSAPIATGGLPDLRRCADTRLLRAIVRPPEDPAQRARAEELHRQAAAARALLDGGKPEQGVRLLQGLVDGATQLGYAPVSGEVLALLGRAQDQLGDQVTAALSLQRALPWAVSAHDDPLAAEIAAMIAVAAPTMLTHPAESEAWADLGDAFLARAGASGDRARAWLAQSRAVVRISNERFSEAVPWLRRAIEFKWKAAAVSFDIAISQDALALALMGMGDTQSALAMNLQAQDSFQQASGPVGVLLAAILSNRGEILNQLGRPAEALAAFDKAVEMWSLLVPPDRSVFAYPLTGIGLSYLALGKPQKAVAPLERALALREKDDPQADHLGETRFALARALWDAGGNRDSAVRLAVRARDNYRTLSFPSTKGRLAEIATWLESHPVPKRRSSANRAP